MIKPDQNSFVSIGSNDFVGDAIETATSYDPDTGEIVRPSIAVILPTKYTVDVPVNHFWAERLRGVAADSDGWVDFHAELISYNNGRLTYTVRTD